MRRYSRHLTRQFVQDLAVAFLVSAVLLFLLHHWNGLHRVSHGRVHLIHWGRWYRHHDLRTAAEVTLWLNTVSLGIAWTAALVLYRRPVRSIPASDLTPTAASV